MWGYTDMGVSMLIDFILKLPRIIHIAHYFTPKYCNCIVFKNLKKHLNSHVILFFSLKSMATVQMSFPHEI